MTGDDTARLLMALLMIVLVGSSLFSRRLPIGATLRMALAWVGIFAAVFVLFLFRDEARVVWDRTTAEFRGDAGTVEGSTLRIPMTGDGHFYARGEINGTTVRFLIDSGATTTTINAATARAASVELSGGFPVVVETANGIAEAQRARVERLEIGPIVQRDAAVHVSDGLGDTNLLGMSFLSQLKSWRVEGRTLVLEP